MVLSALGWIQKSGFLVSARRIVEIDVILS
jgi:hypothetical protein